MKIKITKDIRKYLILYLTLVICLFLLIEIVPKMTNIFETTQTLEPGDLVVSEKASGYVVKTEYIAVTPDGGPITYLVKENAPVRKNQKVVSIVDTDEFAEPSGDYTDVLEWLDGYEGLVETKRTPISGLFSLSMDGAEKELNPAHLDDLTYEHVKNLSLNARDMKRENVSAGDPVYKVTNDNRWYIVSWMKEKTAENYTEGQSVKLQLPAGTCNARVRSISKEGKRYKVIFSIDVYYSELTTVREVDMTIESSEQSGLLVDNGCIIEKDGHEGVYVRDKNGDFNFVRINVIESDGKESVISESTFIDLSTGDTVVTVNVYDEVLKSPKGALRKDQREEQKKKKESTGG